MWDHLPPHTRTTTAPLRAHAHTHLRAATHTRTHAHTHAHTHRTTAHAHAPRLPPPAPAPLPAILPVCLPACLPPATPSCHWTTEEGSVTRRQPVLLLQTRRSSNHYASILSANFSHQRTPTALSMAWGQDSSDLLFCLQPLSLLAPRRGWPRMPACLPPPRACACARLCALPPLLSCLATCLQIISCLHLSPGWPLAPLFTAVLLHHAWAVAQRGAAPAWHLHTTTRITHTHSHLYNAGAHAAAHHKRCAHLPTYSRLRAILPHMAWRRWAPGHSSLPLSFTFSLSGQQ